MDIPLTGKITPVEVTLGSGDAAKKWGFLTCIGQQQDTYQGFRFNLAPDTNNMALYIAPAASLVGTINPGRNSVEVRRAEIDYDTWTLTIEAEMPTGAGGTAPFVATGKLENLGSWVNRRYSGTYTHGAEQGVFLLTLN